MKICPHLLIPLLLTACPIMPGPSGESTDGADGESSSSGDGDGDGDGDGGTESGDGDGDSATGDGDGDGGPCLEPMFGADSSNMRWVTFESWPEWAQFAEPVDLQEGIDAGTLVPVELGLEAECFEIAGFTIHTCVLEVECVELLGYPLSEISIVPGDCAMVGGAWALAGTIATMPGCWGAIDGFAVRLRADAPMCDGPAGDVGCECSVDSCLDGLTCKSGFCSP